jgi:hypothetical protein
MKLLTLSLFFSCLFATILPTSMNNLQMITVSFPGELPTTKVNGKPIRCHCGKAPVEINVLNGIVSAYCEEHLLNV